MHIMILLVADGWMLKSEKREMKQEKKSPKKNWQKKIIGIAHWHIYKQTDYVVYDESANRWCRSDERQAIKSSN